MPQVPPDPSGADDLRHSAYEVSIVKGLVSTVCTCTYFSRNSVILVSHVSMPSCKVWCFTFCNPHITSLLQPTFNIWRPHWRVTICCETHPIKSEVMLFDSYSCICLI